MSDLQFELIFEADAEVDQPDHDHVQECVDTHPGEPCPGYPHSKEQ
jgi:hypothetical protein